MGHRHLFSTSQTFDNEPDQGWNHMHSEQPYAILARSGTTENRSFFNPVENMVSEGMHFSSPWNSAPRPNGYTTSGHSVEGPHYQSDAPGPPHDPFLHSASTGMYSTPPENYIHHASSSNYNNQTLMDGGFIDLTMGNVRGSQKRKSPGVSSVCERGSSSRYYGDRTSSDMPLPNELSLEKSNTDSHYTPWDSHRSNGLSIRGEASTRNVRSRPTLDLESNVARTHFPNNPSHGSYSTSHVVDHSSSVVLLGQTSHALTREWSSVRLSPGSGDVTGYTPETNNFLSGRNSANNTSMEMGSYHHGFVSNRNPNVAQTFSDTPGQYASGVRSSYSQRSIPTYRASSSGLRLGHLAHPDERSQLMAETYPSRYSRPLPNISWRSSDRSGRRRSSHERFQPPFDEVAPHDRFSSEGFMVVDRSAYYASRNMFDQHRGMRLDIDNMTYEELLALGDRIGNVNTGLSEDSISKCLRETIHFSSDQSQEEGTCVICLEEYKEEDDLGRLKTCGHDYHASCIKKWLSMKNLCPVCKAAALPDDMKNK